MDEKAKEIFARLQRTHPDAHIELDFSTPLELLVATILSAQCTDLRVNIVTKDLFRKYRKPGDYLAASSAELEDAIRTTGFFRNKAKSVRGAMQAINDEFGGKVPETMEQLTTLPGVGRKTANVLLGNAFDKPGLPVDTHVTRVSQRLGLTTDTDAVKIEYQLNAMLPPKQWTMFSHLLIFHGRRICKARKPLCEICPLTDLCRFYALATRSTPTTTKKSAAAAVQSAKAKTKNGSRTRSSR